MKPGLPGWPWREDRDRRLPSRAPKGGDRSVHVPSDQGSRARGAGPRIRRHVPATDPIPSHAGGARVSRGVRPRGERGAIPRSPLSRANASSAWHSSNDESVLYMFYHATNYVFTHAVKRARRVVTIHDMTLVLFPGMAPTGPCQPHDARYRAFSGHRGSHPRRLGGDARRHRQALQCSFRPHQCCSPRGGRVVPAIAGRGDTDGPVRLESRAARLSALPGDARARKNLPRLLQAVELAGNRIGPLVIAGADGWGSDEVARRIERLQGAGRSPIWLRPRQRPAGAHQWGARLRVPLVVRGVRAPRARGDGLWRTGPGVQRVVTAGGRWRCRLAG